MMQLLRRCGFRLIAALAIVGVLTGAPALAQERFEVTSIKAVRPKLVDTISALQQRDVAKARAAFEAYDSAWNGIEVYVNVRNRDLYRAIEVDLQAKVTKALEAANPDPAAILPDVQAMLGKFDEIVSIVERGPALNPLFDEVARLRIVRAHLREVPPALKAGNFDKARKSYQAFDEKWDSIEDLIKVRSNDAYVAIEAGMIEIEKALEPQKPDVDKVTALVNNVMTKYNDILGQIARDARARQL
jgi:hypothetical protein